MVNAYVPTAPYRASASCLSSGTLVGGSSAMGDQNDATYARLTDVGQRVVARFPPVDQSTIPEEWALQAVSLPMQVLTVRAKPDRQGATYVSPYIKPYVGYFPAMASGTSNGIISAPFGIYIYSYTAPQGWTTNYWYYTDEWSSDEDFTTWAAGGDLGVEVELTSAIPVTIYEIYFQTITLELTWTPTVTPPDDDGGGGGGPILVGSGVLDRSDRRFER